MIIGGLIGRITDWRGIWITDWRGIRLVIRLAIIARRRRTGLLAVIIGSIIIAPVILIATRTGL
jgi:hypothetical protein